MPVGYNRCMSNAPLQFTAEQAASLCSSPLHPEAVNGLRLFNQKQFYQAHEAFETAWRAEPGPIRELYRAILQIGAGYYQIQRRKYEGGIAFFTSCRKWINPYPDTCRGINIAKLRHDYQAVEVELLRLGPQQIASFNQDLFQPVEFYL
jgi:uncharacterized protein